MTFRILPEIRTMLREAALKEDISMGRYIEKALLGQISKDERLRK